MSHHFGCDSNHGRPCNCFKKNPPEDWRLYSSDGVSNPELADASGRQVEALVQGSVWDVVHLIQERCLSADIRIAELGEQLKDVTAVLPDLLREINELKRISAGRLIRIELLEARVEALTADLDG